MHHAHIDRYAHGDSPVHRLDARAKLLAVLAYSAVLISFDRHALAVMAPMAAAPLAMLWCSHVPAGFALRRVLVLSPFILMLCLASPVYDRAPVAVALGPWRGELAAGWLTAGNIALKFALGMLALTAVMATTPFSALLEAMRRLGSPKALVMQLSLLYRYLFVLVGEALRIRRGRDFRGSARAPVGRRLAAVGGAVGVLFMRTLERSERVQTAMAARGWRGESRSLRALRWRPADTLLLAAVAAYLAFCRGVYPWLV